MNFATELLAQGPIFTSAAKLMAEAKLGPAIHKSSDVLASAIRAAAPVATGRLRAGVIATGFGTSRRVEAREWYAIPVQAGQKAAGLNAKGRENVAAWAGARLGLDATQARRFAFAWSHSKAKHPIKPNPFFYGTFDRLAPMLQQQYLEPVGLQIVKELE